MSILYWVIALTGWYLLYDCTIKQQSKIQTESILIFKVLNDMDQSNSVLESFVDIFIGL